MFNEIVIPKTLEDYVKAREAVIARYATALHELDLIDDTFSEIYRYGIPGDAKPRLSISEFTKQIDRALWRQAFDATGFNKYMDNKARKDFENSLDREPPAFSIDNIRSTFLTAAQDADMMFNRGVVEIFRYFSKEYKTNQDQTFTIDRKFIVGWIFERRWSGGGLQIRYASEPKINDLDRVVKVCAGLDFNPRELESNINKAMKANGIYEDDFYRIKGFNNGNAHIELKKQSTIDQINECIAAYYGSHAVGKAA